MLEQVLNVNTCMTHFHPTNEWTWQCATYVHCAHAKEVQHHVIAECDEPGEHIGIWCCTSSALCHNSLHALQVFNTFTIQNCHMQELYLHLHVQGCNWTRAHYPQNESIGTVTDMHTIMHALRTKDHGSFLGQKYSLRLAPQCPTFV